jgi:simple sugar transport system ATP-binding protein
VSERAPELSLRNIVKSFGATRALRDASLLLKPGTVHALLGENGAGKTTLMRIAFGLIQPDAGGVALDGAARRFRSPADAIVAGLGMVHQHFTNVGAMTVAENVALGGKGSYSPADAVRRVRELTARTRLALDPDAIAGSLPVSAQQKLEIIKALARRARILILDEPTAVLAPNEARELLAWASEFAANGGSVVLITHKLSEALSIADDVTVLRRGTAVFSSRASETTAAHLASAMLGEAVPQMVAPPPARPAGEVVLRLRRLSLKDARGIMRLSDIDLEVRRCEILGVAAVESSGHELLLRAIADRATPVAGTVQREGSVGFIPEDRHRDALVLGFSLSENVALRNAGRRRGRMNWSEWKQKTATLVAEYEVRGSSVDASAAELSGGNQQKLVLARELSEEPTILVAENPTRGLDIRATAAVHARLLQAASAGAAVVLYSSDLDEVFALATRMIAVHAGRVVVVPNDREAAGRAMLGLS